MKNFIINKFFIHFACLFSIIIFFTEKLNAQSGNCDSNTPYYFVDLSSSADSIWISPLAVRDGNCCGTTHPDRCIEFYITMNPGTIAIRFNINSGAIPSGSMYYQINCGPQIPVGDAVCLQAPGPYTLTFCKPGENENTYKIEAIPTPNADFFFADVDGYCNIQLNVVGLDSATVQWTDITYDGFYDSYLSCTNCLNPIVNFTPDHPSFVDYQVCGEVLTPECTISLEFCDTVRVYFYDQLNLTLDGDTTYLCEGDSAISLIPIVNGGLPPYQFYWYLDGNILSNDSIFEASESGTYILEVRDSTYPSCSAILDTIFVNFAPLPTITASATPNEICLGASAELTTSSDITGTTFNWSDGLDSNSTVTVSPTITTTYSVTGTTAEGCTGTTEVTVTVHPLPTITASANPVEICLGESTELTASSDIIGTTFEWSDGLGSNSTVTVSPTATTTYSVTGTTLEGCTGTAEVTVTVNPLPTITASVTPSEICLGESTELTASSDIIGTTFNWSNSLGTNPTVTVSPTATTTYSVTGTTLEGCTGTAEVTVTVHPLPTTTATATPNEICFGASTELTASSDITGTIFNWSDGLGSSLTVTVSPTATTTYSVTGTTAEGCSGTAEVTVTVHPLPTITASATPNEICLGASTELTASSDITGTTFNWSNSLGVNPTVTVNPTTSTTYSVTGTTNEGCTGSASVTVTVHPLPTITAIATPVEICLGESSDLTVSSDIPGTTFSWSNGLGTNPNVTVSPTTTTTYSITGTTNEGCTGTAEVTVTVHPLPTITASANPVEICLGESTELTASSDIIGTTFNWSGSLGAGATKTVSPTISTTYSVTGTTLEGCTGTAEVTVTVHPLPTITTTANPVEICLGASTELTASSDITGTTFNWSGSLGAGATKTISPTATTTYSVTGTTAEGCTGTAEVTVTVHPLPTITASANPSEICLGESTELTASSDITGTTFNWSGSLGAGATKTVSPTISTTYSVTGTTLEGCTGTAEVTVTVHPLPTITATATPVEICLGASAELTASSDITGTTFNWSNSLGTNPTVTVSPTTSTTYTVTGTTLEGCTGTAEVTVTVHPLPTTTATATPNEICFGASTELTASSDITGTIFNWSDGLGSSLTVTVSPTATTTYSVTGTTLEGCTGTAEVTVTVHPLPTITASANPSEICLGASAELTASSDITGTTFNWSGSLGAGATKTVSPTTSTTYTVTGTTGAGCTGTAEVTVTVHPLPTITATATPVEICLGASAELTASSDITGTTFNWSNSLGTNPTVTVSPTTSTTYTVTGTTGAGCTGTATVSVTVNPLPSITATATPNEICLGASTELTASSDIIGTTFNWSDGLGSSLTVTVSPTTTTTYSVTGTTLEGCTGTAEVTVTVHPLPTITASVTPSEICLGASTELIASSDITGTTFNWSGSLGAGATKTVSPITTTTYSVTGTTAEGCTGTAEVTVTVHPLPTITTSATPNEICLGESTDLTASSDITGTTFNWSGSLGAGATKTVSPI
ncbi:MAG TPA: hypothetical protein PLS14_06120, partial [Bacteroidales bacterium]|nr:hypothetical protein [Bacteroidales bacterium]